jgi:KipI family sensor histidine kinase inhibitor
MVARQFQENEIISRLIPLGDRAILVRFGNQLTLEANHNAQVFADLCREKLGSMIDGCSSNLVSVILRYDPFKTQFNDLKNQIMLLMSTFDGDKSGPDKPLHNINVIYGGKYGPCLQDVCEMLELSEDQFIKSHTSKPLHALALGFSPGFLYLGLHDEKLRVPRREQVQENVPAGSILFAAGQTAITSRPIRTGWHVIGQTDFRNFDSSSQTPIMVNPGELVQFQVVENL